MNSSATLEDNQPTSHSVIQCYWNCVASKVVDGNCYLKLTGMSQLALEAKQSSSWGRQGQGRADIRHSVAGPMDGSAMHLLSAHFFSGHGQRFRACFA